MGGPDRDGEDTLRVLRPPGSRGEPAEGRRVRARVIRRWDGLFGFVEEVALGPGETWMTLSRPPTICETADAAEREARAALTWLRDTEPRT